MDRIREAVSRARSARPEGELRHAEQAAAPAPAARFTREPVSDASPFAEVHCNFDDFEKHRIISNEQDPVLNAYRVLRTRVLQRMETEGWRTLAVVSANSGAGKTVTAINLSIAIGSKRGSRSLLVDLDFYRPSVAKYLGITEAPSILDYYEGTKPLQDVTVRPDLADMLLIANERVSRRGADYLTSARTDELIERGIRDFKARVIVFDISPLLGCDDTIAFLPKVDCVLMVASSGHTKVSEFKEAQRLLGRTPVIGTVLNKAPGGMANQNYYYR